MQYFIQRNTIILCLKTISVLLITGMYYQINPIIKTGKGDFKNWNLFTINILFETADHMKCLLWLEKSIDT